MCLHINHISIIYFISKIADLSIAVRTKLWNWFNFISITLLSIVIYIIYMLVSHYWTGTLMEYTPLTMLTTPQYWLL